MKSFRFLLLGVALSALVAGPVAPASADHGHATFKQGPACGGKWKAPESCSFRYAGGQIYVGANARGTVTEAGGATVRLEARSRVTGERRVLLSCTTPANGGCGAGGTYDMVETLRKGQKLFCIVDGVGRGNYECGTTIRKR